jgi:hypothetical protein
MSKLIALRIPDDLMGEIEARANGGNLSQTIIGMLRGNSVQVVEEEKPVEMIITKPAKAKKSAKPKEKEPCDHHAIGDDEPIAREIESAIEAEVEEPAVSGGCRKHPGAGGFPKAGGWWCITCGKIV